jgi:hypothetical protein
VISTTTRLSRRHRLLPRSAYQRPWGTYCRSVRPRRAPRHRSGRATRCPSWRWPTDVRFPHARSAGRACGRPARQIPRRTSHDDQWRAVLGSAKEPNHAGGHEAAGVGPSRRRASASTTAISSSGSCSMSSCGHRSYGRATHPYRQFGASVKGRVWGPPGDHTQCTRPNYTRKAEQPCMTPSATLTCKTSTSMLWGSRVRGSNPASPDHDQTRSADATPRSGGMAALVRVKWHGCYEYPMSLGGFSHRALSAVAPGCQSVTRQPGRGCRRCLVGSVF